MKAKTMSRGKEVENESASRFGTSESLQMINELL